MADSNKKGSKGNPYTMSEYESMANAGTWQGGYVKDDSGNVSYVMKELSVSGYSCGSYKSGSGSGDYQFASYTSFSGDPSLDDDDDDDGYGNGGIGGGTGGSGGSSGESGSSSGGNTGGIVYNNYQQGAVNFTGSIFLWGGPEGYGLAVAGFAGNYVIQGRRISIYVEGTNSFSNVEYNARVSITKDGQSYYSESLNPNCLPSEMVYATGHHPIGTCSTDLPLTGKVVIEVQMGVLYSGETGHFARNTSYKQTLSN